MLEKKKHLCTIFFRLITDHELGVVDSSFGPYRLNKGSNSDSGFFELSLAIDVYIQLSDAVYGNVLDEKTWHGRKGSEELAALFSLFFGNRIISCGFTSFESGGAALPITASHLWGEKDWGACSRFLTKPSGILPNVMSSRGQNEGILGNYYKMNGIASIALTKAARCYQDALWWADLQPELSWLLLINAVEAAANYWYKDKHDTNEDLLKCGKPGLYERFKISQRT